MEYKNYNISHYDYKSAFSIYYKLLRVHNVKKNMKKDHLTIKQLATYLEMNVALVKKYLKIDITDNNVIKMMKYRISINNLLQYARAIKMRPSLTINLDFLGLFYICSGKQLKLLIKRILVFNNSDISRENVLLYCKLVNLDISWSKNACFVGLFYVSEGDELKVNLKKYFNLDVDKER